jgi:hypothetical protein
MRLVSTYSLQGASRGQPQILEMLVAPADNGQGVRLLVNEIPYGGPAAAGQFCTGLNHYLPISASEKSFVLADKLAFCRFTYLSIPLEEIPRPEWVPKFEGHTWPRAVRIEMAPLEVDHSRLQPISVTAVIRVHRNAEIPYGDY